MWVNNLSVGETDWNPIEFMRNALMIGVFLGILGAVVGSYLIVQQMSMSSGVISHAVVPGLSVAFFFASILRWGLLWLGFSAL